MKRRIAFLMALALVLAMLPFGIVTSAASGYPSPSKLNGANDVFLSYCFNSTNWSAGRRTVEKYKPLVGYYDTDDNLQDIFFDSYLFLPCMAPTPSGASIHRNSSNPSIFSDWVSFVDDVFYSDNTGNYNVAALNEAVGEIKDELGPAYANLKINVFFSVLYPNRVSAYFGDVDGDGVNENMTLLANRQKAIKWMVDEQLSRFNNGDYENLNLTGFYWYEESMVSDDQELPMVKYFNNYVHNLGYKTIWIPYYNAAGYNQWETYGFDVVSYQPNYMFYENLPADRVTTAANTAKNLGMCVEMEVSGSALNLPDFYNRYMTYLIQASQAGANAGIKMYYDDGGEGVYYTSYLSDNPSKRKIYDLTYKYAKQTLNPTECEYINPFETSISGYEIITKNKSYTATRPYTNTTYGYGQVSGSELTDGVYGTTVNGTEWIGFHKSNMESDNKFYATIDLGQINYRIDYFAAETMGGHSGIGETPLVEVEVSTNGTTYTSVGAMNESVNQLSITRHSLTLSTPVNARYIRFKFTPASNANFVFVSEIMAGKKLAEENRSNYTSLSQGKSYTATVPYTDTTMGYGTKNGTELTNGLYGSSDYGAEWHAFHVTKMVDNQYNIIVDLGKEYNLIDLFEIEFNYIHASGIGLPDYVTYYVSNDGVNYTLAGTTTPLKKANSQYYLAQLKPDTGGRYIKAVFNKGGHNFVFASEFFIGISNKNLNLTDYTSISKGKSYTATVPYTNTTMGYGTKNGTELTNGIYGSSAYGAEWHAFHVSNAVNNQYNIVLDLGVVYSNVGLVSVELNYAASSSIGLPNYVSYYTSNDGINFTYIGRAAPIKKSGSDYYMAPLKIDGTARYIKAVMDKGSHNFIFVSEIFAGLEPSGFNPSEYTALSTGKSCTGTVPYTNTGMDYGIKTGGELTDGIYGKSNYGREWYALHVSNAVNDQYHLTIDLGATTNSINKIAMEFHDMQISGIALPENVYYYVSDDGENFTLAGITSPTKRAGYYTAEIDVDASARYVKAVMDKGSKSFVFVSEFFIGSSD